MEDARKMMTDEFHRLRNENLKCKEEVESTKQKLKTAEETVNKYGQFVIPEVHVQMILTLIYYHMIWLLSFPIENIYTFRKTIWFSRWNFLVEFYYEKYC